MQWEPRDFAAFGALKQAIANAGTVHGFDPTLETHLKTDASGLALGAVLMQKNTQGDLQLVAYASKVLNGFEQNYSNNERELKAVQWAITEKFRIWLEGVHVNAWTDCEGICGTARLKDPSKRSLRLILKLQSFDYTIRHCSGKNNVAADFLSRMTEEEHEGSSAAMRQHEVVKQQSVHLRGRTVEQVKQLLRQPPQAPNRWDRLLLKACWLDGEFVRTGDGRVIPEEGKRQGIIETYHSDELSHLDFKKTWAVLKERFYWPKMKNDVRSVVMGCGVCFRFNTPTVRRETGIVECIRTEKPRELLSMDYVGPLPTGRGGMKHCLLCVDHFSKMGFGKAVRAPTAEATKKFVAELFAKHGRWETVLSDRGAAFVGKGFVDFLHERQVGQRWSTAGHPQSNGAAERFVRTISGLLRKTCGSHGDWPNQVSAVLASYNAAWHSGTGATPHEVFTGKKWKFREDSKWNVGQSAVKTLEQVRAHKRRYQSSMEKKKPARGQFVVGDTVYWAKILRSNEKFLKERKFWQKRWGPFTIVRVLKNGVYKLEDAKNNVVVANRWDMFKWSHKPLQPGRGGL
jgi:hypothetical protein